MARQRSTGIAASLSSMFEWKVASHDANQAYIILYSRQEYEQGRFHNTSPELNIEIGNYLTLLKPLYGLTDSGDIWYDTLFEFLENDMGMRQCVSDRALLYLRKAKGYIIGLFRCFVDDIFISGTETFHTVSKTLSQRFLSRDRESNSFTLAGVSVLQINPKSYISLSQTRYGHDIPLSNTETSFKTTMANPHRTRHIRCCSTASPSYRSHVYCTKH
jgi:Reverse transcriptase (RNA-dependent DNA polymerase)